MEALFDVLANAVLKLVSAFDAKPSKLIYAQSDSQDRIVQLEKQAYSLLVEASKIRGIDFAFNEPLFSTWTLERFSTFRN
jgi:hypothetical protein